MEDKLLNVAILQSDLVWENPEENRKLFKEKIEALPEQTDLVVLPEMFTSGFTMNPEAVAETMEDETVEWLKLLAKSYNTAITGSIVVKRKDTFRNRLLFVEPNGTITHYDKRHSFTLAGEHKVYESGLKKVIINYKGFKICPLICYDLRFPVWSRNTEDYDLLIYVANWPKVRTEAWTALLKARAIENMSYTIGVNRVGEDANQHQYSGCSIVYDMLGKALTNLPPSKEGVVLVKLSKNEQDQARSRFGFLNDADEFNLI